MPPLPSFPSAEAHRTGVALWVLVPNCLGRTPGSATYLACAVCGWATDGDGTCCNKVWRRQREMTHAQPRVPETMTIQSTTAISVFVFGLLSGVHCGGLGEPPSPWPQLPCSELGECGLGLGVRPPHPGQLR